MEHRVKLCFRYSDRKISALLTKTFTGSYCYHVGWVDTLNGKFYDMHLIRRRRKWPHYTDGKYILVNPDVVVPAEYLEDQLDSDVNTYGWKDYLLFALRPLYHLVGKSTPNTGGVICSEMIYNDHVANGSQMKFKEAPSPADLENYYGVKWNG